MKYILCLAMIGLSACSGGSSVPGASSPSGSTNTPLKILASNVIMGTAQAADGVDTTTKVLASNVTLDTKGLSISATNVQDAFGETEPDPATALVGNWSGTFYRYDGTSGFSLKLNADGTFTCSGSVDLFSSTGGNSVCQGAIAWDVVADSLRFKFTNSLGTAYKFLSIIKLRPLSASFSYEGNQVVALTKQ